MSGLEFILEVKGLSKKEASELLGETPQVLNNWLNRGIPKKKLSEISSLLNVPTEYIDRHLTLTEQMVISNKFKQEEFKNKVFEKNYKKLVKEITKLSDSDDAMYVLAQIVENLNNLDDEKIKTLYHTLILMNGKDVSWGSVDRLESDFEKDLFLVLKKHNKL